MVPMRVVNSLRVTSLVLAAAFWAASPARAADPPCLDPDRDGHAVCPSDCDPTGITCDGDCNEFDADIHPGAAERCDGIDNNCNGHVDEGFSVARESDASTGYDCTDGIDNDGDGTADLEDPECMAGQCGVSDPPGCAAGDPGGCCISGGQTQCTEDGRGAFCSLADGQHLREQEEPAGSARCFDGRDNDCDGFTDHQEPACQTAELCNGFDDDNQNGVDDGFDLGSPCTAGIGFCERAGMKVCDESDLTTTKCNASAGSPSTEKTPGTGACEDGVDNDCDGTIDVADPSCQVAETCDGQDNDGDGEVDEDFTMLGGACSTGVGACHADGVRICSPDGGTTICTAMAAVAEVEGPVGPTCSDGLDNDCDGLTDTDDANCHAAALSVKCVLPFTVGGPGRDCQGKHRIGYEVSGASPTATVTAELLGLDPTGAVLFTLPVQDGDEAHLASRVSPGAHKASSKTNSGGRRHEMFAPVPLLRVTVDDGGVIARAFCSNIPYLDVVAPTGDVVSASEGDVTLVTTAIPFVEPSSLSVLVDGVNILAKLGIDPATTFREAGDYGPFNGTVVIRSKPVQVEDLFIRTSLDFATPSANSLTMTLRGLGGGGHIVFVRGEPSFQSPPQPRATAQCLFDDIRDTGTAAVLGVTIASPAEGENTDTVPTPVRAEVRHGRGIAHAEVNGRPVDMSLQTCTSGDGVTSTTECALPISLSLPQTNLTTGSSGGTFDSGQNDVLIGARDDQGNLAFAERRFTIGDTLSPTLPPAASQALQSAVEAATTKAVTDELIHAQALTLKNAMVLGVSADGLRSFFDSTCRRATSGVKEAIRKALIDAAIPETKIPDPTFDIRVRPDIKDVHFNGDLTCTVTAQQDKVHVVVGLPEITAVVDVTGSARLDFFGSCLVELGIDSAASASLKDFRVEFDITEEFALAGGEAPSDFIMGSVTAEVLRADNRINCLNIFLLILAGLLVFVFFLLIGVGLALFLAILVLLSPIIGIVILNIWLVTLKPSLDIGALLHMIEKDPVMIQQFNIDEVNAELKSKLGFVQQITDVQITPEGLVASLDASWEVFTPDPDGLNATSTRTVAPPPVFPIPNSKDAFFAMSDDLFGLLYSGLTIQGAFQAGCTSSSLTVADLLPDDCNTLTDPAPDEQNRKIGSCHGAKGDAACVSLANNAQRLACASTRARLDVKKIYPTTPLLFCARRGISPRLLIEDDDGTPTVVETRKHFNDLKVAIVLDRDPQDGQGNQGDGHLGQPLATTFGCFNVLSGHVNDCKLADVCLDVDVNNNFTLGTTSDGDPEMIPTVGAIQRDAPGTQCGGGLALSEDDLLDKAGASDAISIIAENIDKLTPLFATKGFKLGGFTRFSEEQLFSIETQTDADCPSCREYFGYTVKLTPAPAQDP